jgi:hypothetical protein
MKRLMIAALALLLVLPFAAQAQDEPAPDKLNALEDAFAPYVTAFEKIAATLAGFEPLPACAVLDNSNLRVESLDGAVTDGAVFCREIASDGVYRLNPGVIGTQSVIERSVRQAYDIFGMTVEGVAVEQFNEPITVCLKGRGALVFLPAFASPRPPQSPVSYPNGDFTCANLGSSGILALVDG